ncbi:MAG TPA: DUF6531 domain-containing protein, partial [Steroidobacteraceae bacterium]|nr:DUF6531 domain-containing protein [Steroidobacteraceae bacterium]
MASRHRLGSAWWHSASSSRHFTEWGGCHEGEQRIDNAFLYRQFADVCPSGTIFDGYSGQGKCINRFEGIVFGQLLECSQNGSDSTQVGDPCDVSTGDFSQTDTDYSSAGLAFTRYYHSITTAPGQTLGVGWTHSYSGFLAFNQITPLGLVRPDGHEDAIQNINFEYISLSGAAIHVQQVGSNWAAYLKDGSSEIYDSTGRLIQKITAAGLVTNLTYDTNGRLASVTGPFGHSLQFTYDSNGRLAQLIDPNNHAIVYGYDANNNLVTVTYQDSSSRTYLYENSAFPNHLTGIVDELSNRFLTVGYDPSTGQVTSSQRAGGAEAVSIVYGATSAQVTDSLGLTSTYTFTNDAAYAPRLTSLSRNGVTSNFATPRGAVDPQRRITQSTDENGYVTTFTYDSDHLNSKTEAFGTPRARTTTYQYLSANSALLTQITGPLRQALLTYYPASNNVKTKTIVDLQTNSRRSWAYTYDTYGRLLTVDGPRTDLNDVTPYAYYTCSTGNECGQLQSVTDAAGNVTTYAAYNAHGQPVIVTDANGVTTTLMYDDRQHLVSRVTSGEITQLSYYPTGLLKKVTLPDSSYLLYSYDAAHRLTKISDGLGNNVVYTLDGMGNRTGDNTHDLSGNLHRTHTRVINSLNQLYQDVNAAGTPAVTTTFAYDSNGNQTSIAAPLSRTTINVYDELNRLNQITDPANGITHFAYDASDNLTSVNDPRSLTTTYSYNGFGDLLAQSSPDTGATTNTYDSAGNLATSTDARGAVATYAYDSLNRVTSVAYSQGGSTDQTISFTYDAGTNGKGHLTGASDANHSMSWSYDTLGRLTSKSQTVGSVTKSASYAYTNGNLTTLTTPSGQAVSYGYNTNHQVTSVTVNGTTIVTSATYEPLGPVDGWTWGNGTTTTRTYDTDGKIGQITSAGTKTFSYDNAFRITGITDTSPGASNWTYGYDALDRISSGTDATLTRGWTYDANGNRLTETGSAASTYTISSTNNQISSISGALARTYHYDAAGNTTSYSGATATYNSRGRLRTVTRGSVTETLIYNALGQRIETVGGAAGTVLYAYDEAGHLLGEYDGTGALIEETVWLKNIPVATLRPHTGGGIGVYYVHTDQLNTPRAVTRPVDNMVMWTWNSDPFGTDAANANPAGAGT